MDMYLKDVFRFSFSLLGDAQRAEDICQESFTRLWSNASQWRAAGRIKNWLLRCAHNLCIDELRHLNRHSDVDKVVDVLADPAVSTSSVMGQMQVSVILKNAVFALPERQRTALMLVHYQDLTNIEAADVMSLSIDALESLLARGRKNLKIILGDQKDILLGD